MVQLVPFFETEQKEKSIGFVFSSTLENIDVICQKTSEFLRSKIKGIESELFTINLVIREGLSNAIRHGNENDPQKKVRFLLVINSDTSIQIEIEDQGNGFDWKKQQVQALPEDEDHGRGIIIMDTYFTHYSYNEKGNILYLEKEIFS
ncbi:MAG: ATP-binding protein [Proteobacteria bacterium]|nr:ATP-binding protein [Pseudomonadota bacterium]MBU1388020.1 ATP-binding protein [Pseudomonadota bacterium]MBU1542083.1 ATP-binding protein [Pseudomonadota bacterium]MBU2430450.1 ATP-binding protein [Pseudomonadota bacterium]MBU2482867.1 ATP-binding protein [Pseudomonadota bacterium]